MDLYKKLRTRKVLLRAWSKVRTSGRSPHTSITTRQLIERFDDNYQANLDAIYRKLQKGTFRFEGEMGVPLPKGPGKPGFRPLVVAPIDNRIVRRAILEVLQGYGDPKSPSGHYWQGVSGIQEVLMTPTSIGGVPARGVPHGLAIIDRAVAKGLKYFVRSDIRDFFTNIPKSEVKTFVSNAVNDRAFTNLFDRALDTNLANEEELKEREAFKLFPDEDVGVAQGSALSALAGNIALREFDALFNGRGVVCVRYIDDFILLGKTETSVVAAFNNASKWLSRYGMSVYGLTDTAAINADKVDQGNIFEGTNVLGYRISGRAIQPSKKSQENLLVKLDEVVDAAKSHMTAVADGKHVNHNLLYHQSMVKLHRIIWGWSQTFRYSTVPHVFGALDKKIDRKINRLKKHALKLVKADDPQITRRISGVHLLVDTQFSELPEPFDMEI